MKTASNTKIDTNDKSMKTKKRNMLYIGIVVALIAVAGTAYWVGSLSSETEPGPQAIVETIGTSSGRGILVTPDNVDEVIAARDTPRQHTHFTTSMNSHWVFPSGSEPSTNANVGNSRFNDFTMYFDVVLSETGQMVFSSPYIPVGERLRYFALDEELPPGEHAAVVTYFLVDDDFQELSNVAVNITLEILG